jgi:hypothetical protein
VRTCRVPPAGWRWCPRRTQPVADAWPTPAYVWCPNPDGVLGILHLLHAVKSIALGERGTTANAAASGGVPGGA